MRAIRRSSPTGVLSCGLISGAIDQRYQAELLETEASPIARLNVTLDVEAAIKAVKGGQVEYRTEKAGLVHSGVGRASFDDKSLLENIQVFVDVVTKARPAGAKGTYIKKMTLSSTMGPGVS